MIADLEVKRVAVAVDVAVVEGVGRRELPGAGSVDALQHGIEGVALLLQ